MIDLSTLNEKINSDDYIAELEQWCKAALLVIERGVELMDNDQLGQWKSVRAVQESFPVRDD